MYRFLATVKLLFSCQGFPDIFPGNVNAYICKYNFFLKHCLLICLSYFNCYYSSKSYY